MGRIFSVNNVGFGLFWAFCFLMAIVSMRFVFLGLDDIALGVRHMLHHFENRPLSLYSHAVVSTLPILILPLQFWGRLRETHNRTHRFTGAAYVACVLVGGIAGFHLGLNTELRPIGALGFILGAAIWVGVTLIATFHIIRKDKKRHGQWMLLSGAMTFAAVGIRFEFPLFRHVFGINYDLAYEMSAWSCWVVNLLIIYVWSGLRAPGAVPRFTGSS